MFAQRCFEPKDFMSGAGLSRVPAWLQKYGLGGGWTGVAVQVGVGGGVMVGQVAEVAVVVSVLKVVTGTILAVSASRLSPVTVVGKPSVPVVVLVM